MILVGIDDTDTLDTPGTNQLARRIAQRLPPAYRCRMVLRHQLFFDPRVPYTSHNGSASLRIEADGDGDADGALVEFLRAQLRDWFVPGSDPGLCVAREVPDAIVQFGHRCRQEVVRQEEAWALARAHGLHLEGFGGTNDGVIGALAAVGLMAEGRDGRVIHLDGWRWPDEFVGPRTVAEVEARGVDEVRAAATGERVTTGRVDIGRHLRPSIHNRRVVLWVAHAAPGTHDADWIALKLP